MMRPATYSAECFDRGVGYVTGVLDDTVPVCRLVRLAVRRHVHDLEHGAERGLYFDPDRVDRVFRFFSLLRHWKGDLAGEQLVLAPWQAFIVIAVYGWVKAETERRRYKTAYVQVARKNGKTMMAGGFGLYGLVSDGERGAEVISAATKLDQARLMFQDAVEMRSAAPQLRKRLKLFKDNLTYAKTSSKMVPLGSNAAGQHGLGPSVAVIDELHAAQNRDMWDVIETATGGRTQPLTWAITTSGSDLDGICFEQREYAEKVLDRTVDDDSFFAFVAEPDPGDDWTDESTWFKGNPNLGVSKSIEHLRERFVKVLNTPGSQNAFRRFELDEWTETEERWLNMEHWRACPAERVPLVGRRAFGGLDLASTQDVAALAVVFPPLDDGPIEVLEDGTEVFEPWVVRCRFWVPAERIEDRPRRVQVLYRQWIRDGWLQTTPGDVIDYKFIRAECGAVASRFDLVELAYDDWGMCEMVTRLSEDGLTMVPVRQGFKSMSPPAKHLGNLVVSRLLNHGDDPVLRWMASNTYCVTDPAENIKPVKAQGKRRHKIDGIVATMMAMGRAIVQPKPPENPYKTRGIGVA